MVGDLALESGLQEPLGQLLQPALAGQLKALGLSPARNSSISWLSTDIDAAAPDGSTDSTSVTLLLVIDASSMIGSYTECLSLSHIRW
jgi:hypothetical protein